jgi:predicted enzyme related to lactoylglutathione lyase
MTTRDTPWPDGTPCWFDLMTTDLEAARTFYGDLFGWQFDIGPEETGYYSVALVDGKAVGGIFTMAVDHPPVWTTYLATGDADATADAAVRAGGTIAQPTMDVMDLGRMTIIQDPTGGTFGTWQAAKRIGAELANVTGTVIWNELTTRGYADAKDFYASVFSYSYTDIGNESFQYSTIESDGKTVGGLGGMPPDVPAAVPPHWRVYFAVDDADESVAKAVSIGAEVLRPAADMPYGRHADLADPQGGRFSVIKPAPGP